MKLSDLKKGEKARISNISGNGIGRRMIEMGLTEGSIVEVMHVSPLGGDPFSIRVRGALIALRKVEAKNVEVSPLL